jgi:hypothetical protein
MTEFNNFKFWKQKNDILTHYDMYSFMILRNIQQEL